MDIRAVIANIDAEIAKLQHAKSTLLGIDSASATPAKRRGRPKGGTVSPEVRVKMVAAQRKRWAQVRRLAT